MSAQDWSRLVATTAPKYMKMVEVNIMKKRRLLALMQAKGRVKFNVKGLKVIWPVEYKEAPLVTFDNTTTVDYTPRDRWKQAELDWRSYILTDRVGFHEQILNQGPEQIINAYGETISGMSKAIANQFGGELYKNGYDASYVSGIHGLESIFQTNVSPVSLQNGFMEPEGTYANLNMLPGTYGGAWSGTGLTPGATAWPVGDGDPEYDFWSPTLVNYTDATSGVYSATTKTWRNTFQEALRKGLTKTRRTASVDGELDLILLNEDLMEQYKNGIAQQLQIHRNEKVGLVSLGFSDTLNFDGVDVATEYGVPTGTGYGINTAEMELNCNAEQLFLPRGPVFDERAYAWLFSIAFLGNMRLNPKFFAKFYNYS